MTDLAIVLLVVVYAGLGYWTGLIRRVIGFVAVYIGFLAATQAAPTAANVILQAQPGWAVPDALTLGYFGIVVLLTVVIEVMASFYHARLQLAALVLNNASGAIVGALTALMAVSVALYLLLAGAQPIEGSPDSAQIQTLDNIRKAVLAPALVRTLGRPAVILFGPVIPAAPAAFYNGQGARAQ
jgi:uncharacterized membrane protein required for colicin V production